MPRVFIGIGSNLGDRAANLELARRELSRLPRTRLVRFSPVYETDPVGPPDPDGTASPPTDPAACASAAACSPQGKFLNAAAELDTQLDPYDLLDALNAIERLAGRPPESQRLRWGPRTLDLDILLYGERVISSDELVVPHPLMHERWFVLKPLADLDPNVVHPLLEMTVGELLRYVEQK